MFRILKFYIVFVFPFAVVHSAIHFKSFVRFHKLKETYFIMVMKIAARSVMKIAVRKAVIFLLCVHLCF